MALKPRGAENPLAPLVTDTLTNLLALVDDMGQSNPNMRTISFPTMRRWQGEVENAVARLTRMQQLMTEE